MLRTIRQSSSLRDSLQLLRSTLEPDLVANSPSWRQLPEWCRCGVASNGAHVETTPRGFQTWTQSRPLLEERLRMAEKLEAVGRLTAGVAHHFNNLLAAAVGRLDLARTAVGRESTAYEDLNAALDARRQAKVLIRQMQDFGQLSEAAPVSLSLNQVLDDLIQLL